MGYGGLKMSKKSDWDFVKATDKTDVSANFTITNSLAKYGSYCLSCASTNDEVDLMIHDTISIVNGKSEMFVYNGTVPGAGEYYMAGPMFGSLEGASEYGYGIGVVLYRDNTSTELRIVSLNSDSSVLTVDESESVTISDSTWYWIELEITTSEGNLYILGKLYSDQGGSLIGELNHNYNDESTRGNLVGGIFKRNTVSSYVDYIKISM
jgi:hypothetical protein